MNPLVRDFSAFEKEGEKTACQALKSCLKELVVLGKSACGKPIPMTCVPLYPDKPFPFGDIVPLGFLLHALKIFQDHPGIEAIITKLEDLLLEKRQGRLWAFHTNRLITATDSSLVLIGIDDISAVKSLEIFYDGKGGYYPQLWSTEPKPDHMLISDSTSHWCQADYATTCIIRWLRIKAGLPSLTSLEHLTTGFDRRGGLFFANPYLTDWALAMAIAGDRQAEILRKRLAQEILSSQKSDGSFGCFDVSLSTALAVMILETLGYCSEAVNQGRHWLGDSMTRKTKPIKATPFYSTMLINPYDLMPESIFYLMMVNGGRFKKLSSKYYAATYYEDGGQVISTALNAIALGEKALHRDNRAEHLCGNIDKGPCHPRYRCKDHAEYIFHYALPPYLETTSSTD